jgi:hypothetical protein
LCGTPSCSWTNVPNPKARGPLSPKLVWRFNILEE